MSPSNDIEAAGNHGADQVPTGWSSWFGGSQTVIGPRVCPVLDSISLSGQSDVEESGSAGLVKQVALEDGNAIQYRTCSWQKTAALLFSEYICLAALSFPWSYSVLGMFWGIVITIVQAALVLYTSLVLWEFCLRHPEVRDVCDIGRMVFWNKSWAWWATAIMFLLNNTFIQGLHVLVGAKYLNTMMAGEGTVSCSTVSYSIIVAAVCWICSLPRTFSLLAKLGTFSAAFTFVGILLATIFAGVQSHPAGYDPRGTYTTADGTTANGGSPIVTAFPVLGTTFVAGIGAFLNISYTFIGQITLPSFIAEMKEPRDFPKALWACTIAEMVLFSVVGSVVYAFVGNQYMTAPVFGSLVGVYKKASFSFMVPTIIFLGVLFASVSSRFVFFRVFHNSRHKSEHTVVGWATWAAILLATWILAFLVSQVIPFFNSLLSLMSSLFDSFFGFIFWGVAYFRMRQADGSMAVLSRRTTSGYLMAALNIAIIVLGFFFLTAGTYATVQEIVDQFKAGAVGGAFSCASNGL